MVDCGNTDHTQTQEGDPMRRATVAAALMLVILSGCFSSRLTNPPQWSNSIESVMNEVTVQVVSLEALQISDTGKMERPYTYGSGVFVANDKVLTAAHLISDSSKIIWVHSPGGNSYRAEVVRIDHDIDLALLSISKAHSGHIRLATSSAKRLEYVLIVGRPRMLLTATGRIAGWDKTALMITSSSMGGMSGSGVFRQGNGGPELLGLLVGTRGLFVWATKLEVIKEFLSS